MVMPQATEAATEKETQATANGASTHEAAGTQAHAVEFPEAPPETTTSPGGHFDVLLDMDVPVTVVLGTTQIPVRRLLQLGPGSVLKLEKRIGAPADLFLKDSRFAEADVVVVENQFAVRIRQIIGAGATSSPEEG
jgi:flagellar motor switch protein FliN/FliY